MKKAILSVFSLCFGLTAFGQLMDGYHPTETNPYAADGFTNPISLDNVYWWKQTKLRDETVDSAVFVTSDSVTNSISKKCTHRTLPFIYNWKRNTTSKSIDYTMNLPYGVYAPVGVGFGDGKSLDISKDPTVAFTFKNTSDSTISLSVGLQDIDKNVVNSVPVPLTTYPGDTYKEEVKFGPIAPGATLEVVAVFKSLTADPIYYANYPKDTCDRGGTPTRDIIFDIKKVAAVTFTVTNTGNAQAKDGYKPYKFNGTFSISQFRVGSALMVSLEDEFYTPSKKIALYPNPVNGGLLNLESVAQHIKITDVMGNVVLTVPSAKEINVSTLAKGVYTLQSSLGRNRFVVE